MRDENSQANVYVLAKEKSVRPSRRLGIAAIALVTCLAATSDNPGQALRNLALTSPASNFGSTKPHQPFAVIMDIADQKGVVSVLVTSSGDASLYLSTGGAIIGGIRHDSVRNAALEMMREAAGQVGQLKATETYAYPAKGNVSFFVRTPEATLTSTVSEMALRERQHPLSPLYAAGQKVITELRRFEISK
ncbi:MAG TPA: hypothetical protein VF381_08425 [Thermoanaerobaculia bacterium]